jgi:roadblock/LC7 domain-containing protein
MIKRLLAVDGIMAICHFRDDGALIEGYGMSDEMLGGFAKFAHDYKRLVQGNADQLAMFTQMNGWTPPGGWVVEGDGVAVASIGNLACLMNTLEGSKNEVMKELEEASHW